MLLILKLNRFVIGETCAKGFTVHPPYIEIGCIFIERTSQHRQRMNITLTDCIIKFNANKRYSILKSTFNLKFN